MKRILLLCLCTIMAFCVVGCGNSGNSGSGDNNESKAQAKDSVKIEEIDYKIESSIVEGDRRVVFSYTNNSKYTIQSVTIDHKMKADVEDEQIKKLFTSFMMEADVKPEEMRNDSILAAEYVKDVEPGDSSGKGECLIGYTYVTSTEQYECYEPDIATIRFIGDDGKLYKEYYDFAESSYSLDEETVDVSQWGTNDKAQICPKPEGANIVSVDESETRFAFDAEGVTQEEFNEYKKALKEAGFTKDVSEDERWYYADSEDGKYDLDVFYDSDYGQLNLYLDNKKESDKE